MITHKYVDTSDKHLTYFKGFYTLPHKVAHISRSHSGLWTGRAQIKNNGRQKYVTCDNHEELTE